MTLQEQPPSSRFNFQLLWSRIRRVSRLDREGILELKSDKTATGQSVALLIFAGLSYGIGFTLLTEFRGSQVSPYGIIVGSLVNTVDVCFAAFVWSATLFIVGTKLFGGKTGFWELSRPLFFSTSPFLFFILISIPFYPLQATVTILAVAWLILLQGFTLKQVMGFSTARTFLTFTVGFSILLFIWFQFG